jgi:C4-dicarboxylate transporter
MMDGPIQMFTKLLAFSVVAVLVMGGGLPFLIMVVLGYAAGMHFIGNNLKG